MRRADLECPPTLSGANNEMVGEAQSSLTIALAVGIVGGCLAGLVSLVFISLSPRYGASSTLGIYALADVVLLLVVAIAFLKLNSSNLNRFVEFSPSRWGERIRAAAFEADGRPFVMRCFSAISIPDSATVLFLIASMSALVWLVADSGSTVLLVAALALLPALLFWLARRADIAVIILIVAAAIPRFSIEISGMKAKPEHIVAGLVLLALFVRRWRQPLKFHWMVPDYLLLAYIALNFLSSLFMSIAPGQTLTWSVQQTLVILPYFFLRVLAADRERFRRAVRMLLWVGVAEGLYAVIAFFSYLLFNTEFGIEVAQYGAIPATFAAQYEANILGSFCGASFIMALVFYFKERSGKLLLAVAITGAGMAVSLSRAAVGAALIAGLLSIYSGLKTKLIDRQALIAVAGTILAVTLVLGSALLPFYIERFSSLSTFELAADPNSQFRLVTLGLALEDIAQHPVLGNGTASFQLLFTYQEMGFEGMELGAWIGNAEMRVLHDTGAIGLIVLVCFLVALAISSRKVLERERNTELLALLLSAVVYCIAFQATEGTLLAFPWVHLGLIGCAVSICNVSRKKTASQSA